MHPYREYIKSQATAPNYLKGLRRVVCGKRDRFLRRLFIADTFWYRLDKYQRKGITIPIYVIIVRHMLRIMAWLIFNLFVFGGLFAIFMLLQAMFPR